MICHAELLRQGTHCAVVVLVSVNETVDWALTALLLLVGVPALSQSKEAMWLARVAGFIPS